jgi:hypothetical protein
LGDSRSKTLAMKEKWNLSICHTSFSLARRSTTRISSLISSLYPRPLLQPRCCLPPWPWHCCHSPQISPAHWTSYEDCEIC